jgi:hypothetical protein
MPELIGRRMGLTAFPAFGAVIAGAGALSGVDCEARLSTVVAIGLSLRPSAILNTENRAAERLPPSVLVVGQRAPTLRS